MDDSSSDEEFICDCCRKEVDETELATCYYCGVDVCTIMFNTYEYTCIHYCPKCDTEVCNNCLYRHMKWDGINNFAYDAQCYLCHENEIRIEMMKVMPLEIIGLIFSKFGIDLNV